MEQNEGYSYKYARAALTADNIVFRYMNDKLYVLLVKRGGEPYKGCWAFPGGFLDVDKEDLEACARRELLEETGLSVGKMAQVGAYSSPTRDPRGHTVTAAFMSLFRGGEAAAGDDAAEAVWHSFDVLPEMAFDHREILRDALIRLFRYLDRIDDYADFFGCDLDAFPYWDYLDATIKSLKDMGISVKNVGGSLS